MQTLFEVDAKDYNENDPVNKRVSARGIVIKDGKLLLINVKKYGYYKFPGGGVNKDEDIQHALIREVREETGYRVIPTTISEYGRVIYKQKDTYYPNSIFIHESNYYLCEVEPEPGEQKLDRYEENDGFTPEWIDAARAAHVNRYFEKTGSGVNQEMARRDGRVIDMVISLIDEKQHDKKQREFIESFGHPEYFEMCSFVKEKLNDTFHENIEAKKEICYSRFEHTMHVLGWAKRLYDMAEDKSRLKFDEAMISAIFHDVGRCTGIGNHAEQSVPITREYLLAHGYSKEKTEYICMLVGEHSNKWKMGDADIDRNLLLLMEADLLDDMGALGIVMDCMITQKRNSATQFYNCYEHICRYTYSQQENNNYMVTKEGRALWEKKTKLVNEFTHALAADLNYEDF